MKFKTTKIYEWEVDLEKERDDIMRIFSNDIPARDRQLAIIEAAMEENFNKAFDLYDELPYNDEAGCPEQEFTRPWLNAIFGGSQQHFYGTHMKYNYTEKRVIEINGKEFIHQYNY